MDTYQKQSQIKAHPLPPKLMCSSNNAMVSIDIYSKHIILSDDRANRDTYTDIKTEYIYIIIPKLFIRFCIVILLFYPADDAGDTNIQMCEINTCKCCICV